MIVTKEGRRGLKQKKNKSLTRKSCGQLLETPQPEAEEKKNL